MLAVGSTGSPAALIKMKPMPMRAQNENQADRWLNQIIRVAAGKPSVAFVKAGRLTYFSSLYISPPKGNSLFPVPEGDALTNPKGLCWGLPLSGLSHAQ